MYELQLSFFCNLLHDTSRLNKLIFSVREKEEKLKREFFTMLKSMTAYSFHKKVFENVELTCEITTHNKRHLEVTLKLPSEFSPLETELRKKISEKITRGAVHVAIFARFLKEHPAEVQVNLPLVSKLNKALETVASEIGCKEIPDTTRLEAILQERGVMTITCSTACGLYKEELFQTLELCVEKLLESKKEEGEAIEREFLERLITMETILSEISQKTKGHAERYYLKMKELFAKILPQEQAEDTRLLKEVAIVAEKSDIAEEILRFSHHIAQFRKMLESQDPQGKTFEFLLQELQREINTIGSKSQDIEISSLVIFAKSEIEKIREQMQNVE